MICIWNLSFPCPFPSLQGELVHANSERAKMRQMVDEVLLLGFALDPVAIAVAIMFWGTLQGTNTSPKKWHFESMIFLFLRWDMLIPWRVIKLWIQYDLVLFRSL